MFLPVISYFSINGFQFLYNKLKNNKKISAYTELSVGLLFLLLSFAFHLMYTTLLTPVKQMYIFVAIVIALLILISIYLDSKVKVRKIRNHLLMIGSIIICALIINLTIFEGYNISNDQSNYPYTENFSHNYINQEEIDVANFINQRGFQGLILTSSVELGRKLGAAGFLPTLPGDHYPQHIYYSHVSQEEVLVHSFFNLSLFISSFRWDIETEYYEYYLLDKISSLSIINEKHLTVLSELGIQYIVAFSNLNNNSIYPYFITAYGHFHSKLLASLINLIPIYNTDHLLVYEIKY